MRDYRYVEVEEPEEEQQDAYSYPRLRSVREEEREAPEVGIIKELSTKRILEQLRMQLKGFFYDYEQKKYVKIEGFEAPMNDAGIAKYLSFMSSFISDVVTFSNFKEDKINDLVLYICEQAIPTISVNYVEYGIKNKSDLPNIATQIFILSSGALNKALNAGDRNVVRGTVSEQMQSRNIGMMPMQEKKSILSKLNPFSRG